MNEKLLEVAIMISGMIADGKPSDEIAIASIKALREPTEAMINTCSLAIAADLSTEDVWHNTIDQILK